MSLTLDDHKAWLKQDSDADDLVIEALRVSAVAFLEREIHSTYDDLTPELCPLFDIAEKQVVAQWYENRSNVTTQTVNQLPISVQRIINLLTNWGSYNG